MHRFSGAYRKLISPLIKVWENYSFNIQDAKPPVFIIGAPRTGSTILYQALTNAYQFAYIDNLACSWNRNLRFGMKKSWKVFGDCPHNNFRAEHGNTKQFGQHAPSECGNFWYRWLPRDRHFVDYDEVTNTMVTEIRREVLGVSDYLKRPILFKNLNVGQRLRLIHRCFPNAKIVIVRRDPRFVVRSIMRARYNLGISAGEWWSIMPPNFKELLSLPEGQMCAAQVYYLEQQIDKDIQLFEPEQVRNVHYQALSNDLLDELAVWTGARRKSGQKPAFRKDNVDLLEVEELEQLNAWVSQYKFKKELFV